MPLTTIPVDTSVRDRLKGYGRKGMTYNDILTRLMDEREMEAFIRQLEKEADAETQWVDVEDL
ncbi:MAG: hypothetical protein LC620_02170 [Halobacteriales archaeon]|nr:hypothetical protein [Halobacteriales archaeon]